MEDLDRNTSPASGLPLAFHGTVIHSISLTELEVLQNCFMLVDKSGKIQTLQADVQPEQIIAIVSDHGYAPDVFPVKYLRRGEFLCPGFVDTHNHAPQWAQRGLGIRGESLLDWLNKVTFAHEAKFADVEYAKRMYASCVAGFLQQGITTASYYGSHHGQATRILADVCVDKGQRALVGKCNMNRNAPEWYRDASVADSLRETRQLIRHVQDLDPENDLVKPILTPRFAISCESDLLQGIGEIAKEHPDLPIQTHFNEAQQEIQYTRQLFPQFRTEADLYRQYGLLNDRTILAHCIFLEEEEIQTLQHLRCGVAHCPISNTTMQEFMVAPIREYLRRGIKVGLGTDSGGGYSSSMLDAMKQAFIVSNARHMLTKGQDAPLSLAEGFFLATLGGAQVCGLEDRVGNFAVGKEFDALQIHTGELEQPGVMSPVEEDDSVLAIFEKFLMTGDDRNIVKVYVRGRSVKV
ncbi:Amidohydrolase 1 [Penicillium argentinense]|uniref:Guanine deaminase n=1 Tax=Penicillium argentinense TaxID=1131581 RepID=A0A9W9KNQ1_9EURO|nr:Amidohydrolase 1 [Penicillium argentinense]KAJ5112800.1 Amidohydrolase 1 [Penicillium argentinense]